VTTLSEHRAMLPDQGTREPPLAMLDSACLAVVAGDTLTLFDIAGSRYRNLLASVTFV